MTSLLDFYTKHGISPVKQDITDLPAHFARRAALYRSLGLPPMAIRDKWVLEIGAGSGDNALYTDTLEPEQYVILEPNPSGASDIRGRGIGAQVIEETVEEFVCGYSFEVVLCEGLLGLCGTDPHALLEAVASHVAPGGVLVITCIDAISDHAEVLRRAMAQRLIDRSASLADQVATLRPVFAPHLATLKGMTRSVDDWIIDNLLNPASIGPTFSIPEACAALDGRFDVLGCSPRFLMDWRWYKASEPGNAWAIASYWQQAHNLYDYRCVKPHWSDDRVLIRDANKELMQECQRFRDQLQAYEAGDCEYPTLAPWMVTPLQPESWFGRGQQYLSFVRT